MKYFVFLKKIFLKNNKFIYYESTCMCVDVYFYQKVRGNIMYISKKDIIIVHMFYLLRWTSKKL